MKKVGPIEIKFNGNESNWLNKASEILQESSETIEKQLTDDTIINGRFFKLDWETVKLAGKLIEPSRVGSK